MVYTQRKWRRSRNEKIIFESQATKTRAGKSTLFRRREKFTNALMIADTRWDDQLASLHNETEATHLLFHQFEPHLVAADAYNYLV